MLVGMRVAAAVLGVLGMFGVQTMAGQAAGSAVGQTADGAALPRVFLVSAAALEQEKAHPFAAITWPEITGTLLLASVTVFIGLYPKILLDAIEPAVKALLAGGGR